MKNIHHKKKLIYQAVFTVIIAGLFIIPGSAGVMNGIQKNADQTTSERGSTIYVDDNNTAGPWDGTIDHPYQFIQDGIDHATDGDTIYVFNGIYGENLVISKSLTLIGEEKENTIITGEWFGTVVKIIAEDVTVTGFTITQSGSNSNNAGIMIHTSHNIITNNNIQRNNYYGLYVIEGNNTIYHNNIEQNYIQAFDVIGGSAWDRGYPSGGNYWSDYTGTDENEDGMGEIPYPTGNSSADNYPLIHPYGSVVNENTQEIFLTIQGAIDDSDTQCNHIVTVKNGVYWEHVSIYKSLKLEGVGSYLGVVIDGRDTGTVVTIDANDVILQEFLIQHSGTEENNAGVCVNSKNCSIIDNIIYKNFQGIILKQSTEDTQITDNEITDNGWNGITLHSGCKANHIFENTIANNNYAGIGITGASNNYIFHNNIKSNRHQAYDDGTNIWDDGYPSGGNYWSDYTGTDNNGDGFGDTPYAIPEGINTDNYPLMAPYIGGDTIPPMVKIQTPSNGMYLWGFRLFSSLLKQSTIIYGPVTIEVEATDAQSEIAQVEFLIDDSVTPEFVATQPPYTWKWSQPYLLFHKHTIIVIAYDKAGNSNFDMLEVRKYL